MLKQNLQLKLSQKLSPQQIQLMKLVQLPTLAFEQRVKQEMYMMSFAMSSTIHLMNIMTAKSLI